MKNKPNNKPNMLRNAALAVLCMLLSFAAVAQNDARTTADKNIQKFLEKRSETPLAKYYTADPNDPIARKAIRLRLALVENKHTGNTMPEADRIHMEKELKGLMEYIVKVDAQVKEGMPYSRAKMTIKSPLQTQNTASPAVK